VKYVAYTRQSKESEGGLSPESQRAEIEHWAAAPGKDREMKWLKPDLDWSGKSLERPAMQEALRLVRSGAAAGIVVSKLDRLTRSVGDLYALIKEAQADGWTIVALDLGVDLLTTNGKMFAGVVGILSEWYLDRVTEEWSKVRRYKVLTQGAHWGAPPLGYLRGRGVNERGQDTPGALMEDPEWAPLVGDVFEQKVAGASWAVLARMLTDAGAPSIREKAAAAREDRPVGGSAWAVTAVQALVSNRVYLGEARSGALVKPGAHPALVDEMMFRRANRKGANKKGERKDGPLAGAGLLRCGGCGSGMVLNRMANGYRFYRCRSATCKDRASIGALKVEAYLVDQAFAAYDGIDYMVAGTGRVASEADIREKLEALDIEVGEVEASSGSKARKVEALTELDAERERLLDDLAGAGEAEMRHSSPEIDRALLLRIDPKSYAGFTYEGPEVEESDEHPLEHLLDVPTARAFLRSQLGRVVVAPVAGRKTVPVEERVSFPERAAVAA
jgi:DNA invertase Pin-like site-specific DNA recombinase